MAKFQFVRSRYTGEIFIDLQNTYIRVADGREFLPVHFENGELERYNYIVKKVV